MKNSGTAFGIKQYQYNFSGPTKLKGIVHLSGGPKLKVWDDDLHAKCLRLAQLPAGEIRFTFTRSEKWGDSLRTIESTKPDHELYSDARARDEQRGRIKPNSYLGHRIAKGVQAVTPTGKDAA